MKHRNYKILTWHVHGNYLYYLTQTDCDFYIPVTHPPSSGYWGKTRSFPWGENVIEIPAAQVKNRQFDCIIFQSNFNPRFPDYNYLSEQIGILSKEQLETTPKIFIEHDPPRKHPTDTKHLCYNTDLTLVHVTSFNQLMWDSGTAKQVVIEHGVSIPAGTTYTGEIEKGIVVVNGIFSRGRRLGLDIFQEIRKEIPLDIIGIDSEKVGGLGEISPKQLPDFIGKYRFFFHPARYTSLGLSVVEAMTVGLPIVGLATTELPNVIENGVNGFIHTDPAILAQQMHHLLNDKTLAEKLGRSAKKTAQKRFSIQRFTTQWKLLIKNVVNEAMLHQNKQRKMRQFLSL